MVNSGLCAAESSPSRKTRESWKIRAKPSASSRFMAYSGLVMSQSGRGAPPPSGWNTASKGARCGSIPGAGTSVGVSTSW